HRCESLPRFSGSRGRSPHLLPRLKTELSLSLTSYFFMQLLKLFPDQGQYFATRDGQSIILARPCAARVFATRQPTVPRHPIQQRVQGSGTDLIAMPAQFRGDPLAMNWLFAGMVQNMHLPESEQDFASFGLHIITTTDIGYRLLLSGCQSPIRKKWSNCNESTIQSLAQSRRVPGAQAQHRIAAGCSGSGWNR